MAALLPHVGTGFTRGYCKKYLPPPVSRVRPRIHHSPPEITVPPISVFIVTLVDLSTSVLAKRYAPSARIIIGKSFSKMPLVSVVYTKYASAIDAGGGCTCR